MLFTLACHLATREGIRISVILMNPGTLAKKLRNHNITTYVIDESKFNSWQVLKQINKIIKHDAPDVIHTHRSKENILGSLAAIINHSPSLRTVHGSSEHKAKSHQLPKRIIMAMDKWCGRFLQKYIVAVAPDLSDKLSQQFPQNMLRTIENGIDTDRLIAVEQPTTHSNQNVLRIGIVGRLVAVKRLDIFIQTAILLKQRYPDRLFSFHAYGDGPLHCQLAEQIKSQSAQEYVHLEGHSNNIDQQIQMMDILVMTSDHEGLPMTLLEAMHLGTPIVAHAVGGIPRLLDNGLCGKLVSEQTAEAFAKAIIATIDDDKKRIQLITAAKERVKEEYSATRTAADYHALYIECSQ